MKKRDSSAVDLTVAPIAAKKPKCLHPLHYATESMYHLNPILNSPAGRVTVTDFGHSAFKTWKKLLESETGLDMSFELDSTTKSMISCRVAVSDWVLGACPVDELSCGGRAIAAGADGDSEAQD